MQVNTGREADLSSRFVMQQLVAVPSWFLSKDGYWLYSRMIQPEDHAALLELFDQLSTQARRRRFHVDVDHMSEESISNYAYQFATVDNKLTGGAIVAVDHRGSVQHIVGVVRLGAPDDGVAEVAVVVRDDFQGRGVGRALLQRMPTLAQQMKVHTVLATIQADNLPALRLFRRLDFPMTSQTSRAETIIHIQLTPD